MLKHLQQYIKKVHPLTGLLLFVVMVSFLYHAHFRESHFQECDSAGTYHLMFGFPREAFLYSAFTYPTDGFISKERAEKLLAIPFVHNLKQQVLPEYTDEQAIAKISESNIFALLRYSYIQGVASLHLPHPLVSMFALPFSATFSPGYGLVYGIFTNPHTSYEDFMSTAMLITTFIIHLGAILVYATGRLLNVRRAVSLMGALLFLGSISVYTGSYDVGSRPWNLISYVVWVWALAFFIKKYGITESLLKRISWITAVLIFFNYLIVFPWIAFVGAWLIYNKAEGFKKKLLPFARSQIAAVIAIVMCVVVFYQPGQGNRGTITLQTWHSDIYYLVLNFFAVNLHHPLWNVVQFGIGLTLVVWGLYTYIKLCKTKDDVVRFFSTTLSVFFVVFVGALLTGLLGLAPTRHIIFVFATLLPGIMLGIEHVMRLLKQGYTELFSFVVIAVLIVAGSWGVKVRRIDAYDRTKSISIEPGVSALVIRDCSYNLLNKNWNASIPVEFVDPSHFEAGKRYQYISQTTPFYKAVAEWKALYDIDIKVIRVREDINPVYFIAYNPDPARFPFSRPNSLYEVIFEVGEINKRQ